MQSKSRSKRRQEQKTDRYQGRRPQVRRPYHAPRQSGGPEQRLPIWVMNVGSRLRYFDPVSFPKRTCAHRRRIAFRQRTHSRVGRLRASDDWNRRNEIGLSDYIAQRDCQHTIGPPIEAPTEMPWLQRCRAQCEQRAACPSARSSHVSWALRWLRGSLSDGCSWA